jgi:transmembrane sensor
MPDGSEIILNKNSTLSFSRYFGNHRAVKLEGEAFFNVVRDSTRPFTIKTAGALVTVLGTSFNVKALTSEGQTEVVVVTGKVRLADATNSSESIVLTPGAAAFLNQKEKTIHADSADINALAWREKKLVFRKTTIRKVVQTLAAYFQKDIRIKSESIANCRFTGTFNDPTLEEVMETLSEALQLDIVTKTNYYETRR